MEQITRVLSVTATVFLVFTLLWNINPRFPRIPFEPYLSKFGIQLYIPLWTSIVASIILTMMFNFFRTPIGG